jgi:hypothetical protein
MKSVSVLAANLKRGDVLNGARIKHIEKYPYRLRGQSSSKYANTGVLIITPNPNGNKLDVYDLRGDTPVVVKRPKYNFLQIRKRANNKKRLNTNKRINTNQDINIHKDIK